jgi:hypothetical protein
MEDRFFSINQDGFITDNNFDFDAGLKLSGDFVNDEKYRYAAMYGFNGAFKVNSQAWSGPHLVTLMTKSLPPSN